MISEEVLTFKSDPAGVVFVNLFNDHVKFHSRHIWLNLGDDLLVVMMMMVMVTMIMMMMMMMAMTMMMVMLKMAVLVMWEEDRITLRTSVLM